MSTLHWVTVRRRLARATIILAALAMCWGGATHLAWRHARPAPSSALDACGPILSPEACGPILSLEARGPILSPEARGPIPSPEARELIDSIAGSAAAACRIRVGLFSDKSCCDEPEPLARILEAVPSCIWEPVTAAEIQANRLGRFDVVVFPGGRGHLQAAALGDEGRRAIRDFVRGGGGFVGICAGAFLATAQYEWSLGLVNTRTLTGDRDMPGLGIRPMAERGAGTVKIELTDEGRAVFGDLPGPIDVAFAGGPIFLGSLRGDLPPFVPLAYYRTEVAQYAPQRGTMIDTPSIVVAKFGAGRVVAISPHPEATRGLEFLIKRSVLATARKPADQTPAPAEAATSSATRPETRQGSVSDRSPPRPTGSVTARPDPVAPHRRTFDVISTGDSVTESEFIRIIESAGKPESRASLEQERGAA